MKLNAYQGGKLIYEADADKSLTNLVTKIYNPKTKYSLNAVKICNDFNALTTLLVDVCERHKNMHICLVCQRALVCFFRRQVSFVPCRKALINLCCSVAWACQSDFFVCLLSEVVGLACHNHN